MEKLLPLILPMLSNLASNPAIQKLLPVILNLAQNFFPKVPQAEAPQAIATLLDVEKTKWVQTSLKLLGVPLAVDGSYGSATKNAVTAFQTTQKLDIDGWAGDVTCEALRKALITKFQPAA